MGALTPAVYYIDTRADTRIGTNSLQKKKTTYGRVVDHPLDRSQICRLLSDVQQHSSFGLSGATWPPPVCFVCTNV